MFLKRPHDISSCVFLAIKPDIIHGKSGHVFGNKTKCLEGNLGTFRVMFERRLERDLGTKESRVPLCLKLIRA